MSNNIIIYHSLFNILNDNRQYITQEKAEEIEDMLGFAETFEDYEKINFYFSCIELPSIDIGEIIFPFTINEQDV